MLRLLTLLLTILTSPAAAQPPSVVINGVTINGYCIALLLDLVAPIPRQDRRFATAGEVPLDHCNRVRWQWVVSACRAFHCLEVDDGSAVGNIDFDAVGFGERITLVVASYNTGGFGNFAKIGGLSLERRGTGSRQHWVLKRHWQDELGDRCYGGFLSLNADGDHARLTQLFTPAQLLQVALGNFDEAYRADLAFCSMCCAGSVTRTLDPMTGEVQDIEYEVDLEEPLGTPLGRNQSAECLADILQGTGPQRTYSLAELRAIGTRFRAECSAAQR